MNTNLFVYGTLMFGHIMHRVTGREFTCRHAVLEHHARRWVRGAPYPGIIPFFNQHTPGCLYRAVGLPALTRLDAFEGALYKRSRVQVRLPNGAQERAHTYILRPEYRHRLTTRLWHPAHFTPEHQNVFLASTYFRSF